MKIEIINGPNLNKLGTREPKIYGNRSFDDYMSVLRNRFGAIELEYFQSNHEGAIIDELHRVADEKYDGVVLNAGAYSHYSYAIADAIRCIDVPVVEVHISNIAAREEFRHTSVLTAACKGMIAGLGLRGYDLAIESLIAE